jgi:hypothetical protein
MLFDLQIKIDLPLERNSKAASEKESKRRI